jgi:hypothetical protein
VSIINEMPLPFRTVHALTESVAHFEANVRAGVVVESRENEAKFFFVPETEFFWFHVNVMPFCCAHVESIENGVDVEVRSVVNSLKYAPAAMSHSLLTLSNATWVLTVTLAALEDKFSVNG